MNSAILNHPSLNYSFTLWSVKKEEFEVKSIQRVLKCRRWAQYRSYISISACRNHLLYQLAIKYMQEQQEELGKVQTYLDKLKSFGEDKIALKLFDNEFLD